MRHVLAAIVVLNLGLAYGQSANARRSVVVALGDGSVSVSPDQGKVNLSVTTQAQTAQAASDQNATIAANVIAQLRTLLGSAGEVRTVGYSLSPMYSSGNAPSIIGYTATNTVAATANDVSLVGRIIDTGIQAGATRVDLLQFGLKDDSAAKASALKAATLRAKAKADAMALALGMRTGAVIVLQEGGASVQTINVPGIALTPTPVVPGSVDVRANVTIEVELVQ